MNEMELMKYWKEEEKMAHIKGWDFSYIWERFHTFEDELPWDYMEIVRTYLKPDSKILDIDTGGGEVLLAFQHPYHLTTVTEGYAPNVKLCEETLGAMGIRVCEVTDYSNMPFQNDEFDLVINRHGDYDVEEVKRVLKPGGVFITQQVGEDNDRELVEFLMPECKPKFPGANLDTQRALFENAGFEILGSGEAYKPIEFYEVGALVWFARVIQWEFVDFSVERCFERLLEAQKVVERDGRIKGQVHRYYLVAVK